MKRLILVLTTLAIVLPSASADLWQRKNKTRKERPLVRAGEAVRGVAKGIREAIFGPSSPPPAYRDPGPPAVIGQGTYDYYRDQQAQQQQQAYRYGYNPLPEARPVERTPRYGFADRWTTPSSPSTAG